MMQPSWRGKVATWVVRLSICLVAALAGCGGPRTGPAAPNLPSRASTAPVTPSATSSATTTPTPGETTTETPPPTTTATPGVTTTGQSPAPVAAGTGTPDGALTGYLNGLIVQNLAQACHYVNDASCNSRLSGLSAYDPSGWQLGGDAVSGNQAVVTVVAANFCFVGHGPLLCINNADPSAGQPAAGSSTAGFAQAFSAAQASGTAQDPAFPIDLVNGNWLVDDGS